MKNEFSIVFAVNTRRLSDISHMSSNITEPCGIITERVILNLSARKTLQTNSYPENKSDNVKYPQKIRWLQYYTNQITIKNESCLAQKLKQAVNIATYKLC